MAPVVATLAQVPTELVEQTLPLIPSQLLAAVMGRLIKPAERMAVPVAPAVGPRQTLPGMGELARQAHHVRVTTVVIQAATQAAAAEERAALAPSAHPPLMKELLVARENQIQLQAAQ